MVGAAREKLILSHPVPRTKRPLGRGREPLYSATRRRARAVAATRMAGLAALAPGSGPDPLVSPDGSVGRACLAAALLVAQQVAAKATRDALFLSTYPVTALPLAAGLAAVVSLAGPPLLDEDYVILSTVHSAKGGEWDVVHVIHAADGMIPSDMATGGPEEIEEERRLLYVALTRARNDLYVYFPLRYYRRPRGHEDAHSYAQLSRFLIPATVRSRFESRVAPLAEELIDEPLQDEDQLSSAGHRAVEMSLARLWEG